MKILVYWLQKKSDYSEKHQAESVMITSVHEIYT